MPTHPHHDNPSGEGDEARSVEARLATLEAVVCTGEVRTRRLVVTDDDGQARIVGEVSGAVAELRVGLAGTEQTPRTAVVVHAGDDPGFSPLVGVQLWGDGDSVAELGASGDGVDRWRSCLFVGTVRPNDDEPPAGTGTPPRT